MKRHKDLFFFIKGKMIKIKEKMNKQKEYDSDRSLLLV